MAKERPRRAAARRGVEEAWMTRHRRQILGREDLREATTKSRSSKGEGKKSRQRSVRPRMTFACFDCRAGVRPGQWMLVRAVQRLVWSDENKELEIEDADSVEQLCPACAVQNGRLAEMQSKSSADERCSTCGRSREGAARWLEVMESIDLLDADGDLWCAAERRLRSVCEDCHPRSS